MGHEAKVEREIFSQIGDVIVANTTAETSALGTGRGNKMIKSDALIAGSRIRIHGSGVYSTPTLIGSTITVRVKIGGTTVASVATTSLLTGAVNQTFTFDSIIQFRSTGVGGSVIAEGVAAYTTSLLGLATTKTFDDLDNQAVVTTVNTTNDPTIDVTVQWGTATLSRTIKIAMANIIFIQ